MFDQDFRGIGHNFLFKSDGHTRSCCSKFFCDFARSTSRKYYQRQILLVVCFETVKHAFTRDENPEFLIFQAFSFLAMTIVNPRHEWTELKQCRKCLEINV